MNLSTVIIPIIVSTVLTALMIPFFIRLSYKKRLFDFENERTVHKGVIPRLGGGAFVLAVMITIALSLVMVKPDNYDCMMIDGPEDMVGYGGLMCSVILIFLVGILDDLLTLNYKYKFLSQLISAVLMVFVGGVWINNFGGLLGVEEANPWFCKIFSVLLVMYMVNAFNLIDGIDGLASSLGIVVTLVMGVSFFVTNQLLMSMLSFVLASSLIVFFCFNKFGKVEKHTKIFMGDGGSQTMGLIIAFLLIYMSKQNSGESVDMVAKMLVFSFCLVIIPCFDAVRVMVARMMRGGNPFVADQTHIHHKFLSLGYNHTATLIAITIINLFFVVSNIVFMESEIGVSATVKMNIILFFDVAVWCMIQTYLNGRIKRFKGR